MWNLIAKGLAKAALWVATNPDVIKQVVNSAKKVVDVVEDVFDGPECDHPDCTNPTCQHRS